MKPLALAGLCAAGAAAVIVNLLTFGGSPPPPRAEPVAPRGPDALATVAGRPITLGDLGVSVERLGAATPAEAHAAIRAALEARLDGELLAAEAGRLGLALTGAEAAELRAREPAPAIVERLAAEAGQTVDAWRAARERAFLGERVLAREVYARVQVTDAELVAYVDAHRTAYRSPDRYHLAAIFISSPQAAAPTHAEAAAARVERAVAALARQPFERVARELSDGLEGARGGDLGPRAIGEPPLDDAALAAAVTALAPGAISGPVRTAAGTWIVKLVAHLPPADLPLAEVRSAAEAALVRERGAALARAYLEGLRARGQVVILLPAPDDDDAVGPVRP